VMQPWLDALVTPCERRAILVRQFTNRGSFKVAPGEVTQRRQAPEGPDMSSPSTDGFQPADNIPRANYANPNGADQWSRRLRAGARSSANQKQKAQGL
jgi:hypothetical protein